MLIALQLDDALHLRLVAWETEQKQDAQPGAARGHAPPGLVYEDLRALREAALERERGLVH